MTRPLLLREECLLPEDVPDEQVESRGPVVLMELGTVDGRGAPEAILVTVGEHVYRYDRACRLGIIDASTGRWLASPSGRADGEAEGGAGGD